MKCSRWITVAFLSMALVAAACSEDGTNPGKNDSRLSGDAKSKDGQKPTGDALGDTLGSTDGLLPEQGEIVVLQRNNSVPPTGDKGKIFVMNIDSSAQTQIVADAFDNRQPCFSPDGTKIAFLSDKDGKDNIYLYDRNTKSTRRLTATSGTYESPAFSPDGKMIVFVHYTGDIIYGKGDIFTISVDNQSLINRTNSPAKYHSTAFSPDGKSVAYALGSETYPTTKSDLYVMDINSGSYIQLTTSKGEKYDAPGFSPDGKKLVYVSNLNGNDDLYTMTLPPATKEETRLTTTNEAESAPYYTKTGKIVFARAAAATSYSKFQIFSRENDKGTSSEIRLTNNTFSDDWPRAAYGKKITIE